MMKLNPEFQTARREEAGLSGRDGGLGPVSLKEAVYAPM